MGRHRWQKKPNRLRIDISRHNGFARRPLDGNEAVGFANEDRAEKALQLLVDEKHIYGFYRTEKDGELDKRGVDFQIDLSRYRIMNLQIKSSPFGAKRHKIMNGDLIPCVVVLPRMSIEQIAEYIREEVERTIIEELKMALIRAQQNPEV